MHRTRVFQERNLTVVTRVDHRMIGRTALHRDFYGLLYCRGAADNGNGGRQQNRV